MAAYAVAIAECLAVVDKAEEPLPEPCLRTPNCRRAGGCEECYSTPLKAC